MTSVRLLSLLAVLLAVTPAQPLPAGAYRISEAPEEWQSAISRADLVIASLHDSLLRELSSALKRGPERAVQSCHVDVTGAIGRLKRHEGILAGRTSDRLRNSVNAPPAWAAPIVQAYAGRRASDIEGFAVEIKDHVGVLRPIVERQLCATCHGPESARPPAVRARIEARFPADRAVGFQNGEIRGWYWVELPRTEPR